MNRMLRTLLLIGLPAALPLVAFAASPDQFNVVWNSHSNISRDSMPVGNGDIGLNVWTEENGDLLFYVGKTDTFDENGRILKLGRIRVHFDNAPFAKGKPFKQELSLQDATIRITAGEGDSALRLQVWVDANNPVVHVESESATPFKQSVTLEMWRTEKRPLSGKWESHYVSGTAANMPPIQYPDTLVASNPAFKNRIAWYHRNETSVRPAALELQGLAPIPPEVRADMLLNRTFGAVIQAEGMVSESPARLVTTAPVKATRVSLVPLTEQTESAQDWLNELSRLSDRLYSGSLTSGRAAHEKWWGDFWNRSDVTVTGGNPKETAAISLGWHLNRFVTACAARGKVPVKFNGAIFTVDGIDSKSSPSASTTADARAWGIPFWFQNQRHIYWPMLQAGDYDQFASFFRMYRDLLPMARHRTRTYYQHGGAFFPEAMTPWGTYINENYGWNRKGKEPGLADNTYIRRYWQGGIELCAMMLEWHRHTGDEAFARETLVPIASEIIAFYDEHYRRDEKGKIRFEPAQALETIPDAVNPTPEIAGLRHILIGLAALPEPLVTKELRERWRRVLSEVPAIPMTRKKDITVIAHAEIARGKRQNVENCDLYAVWPYRQYGILGGELKLAQDTFRHRDHRYVANSCWHNDILFAAQVGMAREATHLLPDRFLLRGNCRFPTFYINGDWVPDLDNGGVCQNTLQSMLMQADEKKIVLLPAWPKAWNASFKLHAPKNTTVEARVENGEIKDLVVTPESRRKDVEIRPAQ
jgi:alpha-L-fucosidase 2